MNTIRICPSCFTPLSPDAKAGICPSCLGKAGSPSLPAPSRLENESVATIATQADAFVPVRQFGDYELIEEIARGGMGVVWKARQKSLNRIVALKMILAGKLADEAEVQRFRREAEAAANLQHPNIVAIHAVGQQDGQYYYSMDFVEGRDLSEVVREQGSLAPRRAAECLQAIAEAVHYAHQRGTLHRDLKPQNILMDAAGVPRITDFGLAKLTERDDGLTQTGAAMGSPSYMPPEQASGHLDQIGPHSDVYSLGAILYETLTGRPPFRGETAVATLRLVMESEAVAPHKFNPAVPHDLETICLKCLEKNPARRYHSARLLAEDLGRFLKHEPIQALPVSAFRKAESWLRQHPWTLMAAASLIALVLTGLLYWQHEEVEFLKAKPSLAGQPKHGQGWREKDLKAWTDLMSLVFGATMLARLVFKASASWKGDWKQLLQRPSGWTSLQPVSPPVRILCAMVGLAALGLTLCYFAMIIRASVWEDARIVLPLLWVYSTSTASILLLFGVARDYQKFVHGLPHRAFPAEHSELLRQAIFEGDLIGAVKIYRRTVPDVSRDEARDFVGRLAAELKTSQPEKFAPPPGIWDLNWRSMRHGLVLGIILLTVFWLSGPPILSDARAWLGFFLGFVIGATLLLVTRLKGFRRRFPALASVSLVLSLATSKFSEERFYIFGLFLGLFMIAFGFRRKRRKLPAKTEIRN